MSVALFSMALGCMAVDCYGPPPQDGEWEPEWEPDWGEDCGTDADCAAFDGEGNSICLGGFCQWNGDGRFCSDNADCAPGVCNQFERVCDQCSQQNPCDVGLNCVQGECEADFEFQIDFEREVVPLFEAEACIACHRESAPDIASDLYFGGSVDNLYDQLLLDARSRINFASPMLSPIIAKPLREDPPDHPVGVWSATDPEVFLLETWILGGAARESQCRQIEGIDCFGLLSADTYCATAAPNGALLSDPILRCAECDIRFGTAPGGLTPADCGVPADGGVTPIPPPDAGIRPDAGLPLDAGAPPDAGERPDAG